MKSWVHSLSTRMPWRPQTNLVSLNGFSVMIVQSNQHHNYLRSANLFSEGSSFMAAITSGHSFHGHDAGLRISSEISTPSSKPKQARERPLAVVDPSVETG